jgi:DNA-binding CsgD family transcriptional regulator
MLTSIRVNQGEPDDLTSTEANYFAEGTRGEQVQRPGRGPKSPEILRLEAEELERHAEYLRERAQAIEDRREHREAQGARDRRIRSICMSDAPPEAIIRLLVTELEMQPAGARLIFAEQRAQNNRAQKRRRNREIVRLARRHTNAELAERYKLSIKHVSRIINDARAVADLPLWFLKP